MRLIQALAISVPAWVLCYFLLSYNVLWTNEWPDLIVLLTLVVCTFFASVLAFLRCDLRVSLNPSQTARTPDVSGSRANIAFLLTGLALGLFPTLIWAIKLDKQCDEARAHARGVEVIVVSEDVSPGDTLSLMNVATIHILKENITNVHFYPEEVQKLVGAKARTFIPARTPIMACQIEGNSKPPEPKRNARVTSLKDLRL